MSSVKAAMAARLDCEHDKCERANGNCLQGFQVGPQFSSGGDKRFLREKRLVRRYGLRNSTEFGERDGFAESSTQSVTSENEARIL